MKGNRRGTGAAAAADLPRHGRGHWFDPSSAHRPGVRALHLTDTADDGDEVPGDRFLSTSEVAFSPTCELAVFEPDV